MERRPRRDRYPIENSTDERTGKSPGNQASTGSGAGTIISGAITMAHEWEERVREIEEDHTSGAADLTRKAAGVFADLLGGREAQWDDLFDLARAAIRAQPEMASIFTLANSILRTAEGPDSFARTRQKARELALDETEKNRIPLITAHLASLLRERPRVVTVSNSSTLRGALLLASERGIRIQLVCAEGRPNYEGRALAKTMSKAAVPVTLVSDAGICDRVEGSCIVLVGADAVRPDTFTNKVGTRALALVARERSVPFYVVTEKSKLLPSKVERRVRKEDPGELWESAPSGVKVENVYFEETPLELVTGVVMEEGVLGPLKAASAASAVDVFPGLWSTDDP